MDWEFLKNSVPNEKTWVVFREDYTPDELIEYDIPAWDSSTYAVGFVIDGQIHSCWDSGKCVFNVGDKATQNWLWKYAEA